MMQGQNAFSRRAMLAMGAAAVSLPGLSLAQQALKEIHELKPGEFTWHPERSPTGPVAIVVSLDDQRVHVYRNGIRIAVSTCSTGRPGHTTPTGVFTVLQKDRDHHSSTYNNAPMPNMNRLTWSGIALHAGNLPGYPASHGCVRLPLEFSRLLFTVTHIGMPVIIASNHSDMANLAHPGLILDPQAEEKMKRAVAQVSVKPRPAQTHVDNKIAALSMIVSRPDGKIAVLENSDLVGEYPVKIQDPQMALGSHVYVLSRAADGHTFWHGIGHANTFAASAPDIYALQRVQAGDDARNAIAARLHEGAILVMTDLALHPDSRSGKDFVVMDAQTG
jgi:hypothetical protein